MILPFERIVVFNQTCNFFCYNYIECVLQCIKCLVAAFNSVGLVLTAVLGYPLCGGCTQVMDHDWVMNVGKIYLFFSFWVNYNRTL